MNKKRFLVGFALAGLLVFFSGCGNKNQDENVNGANALNSLNSQKDADVDKKKKSGKLDNMISDAMKMMQQKKKMKCRYIVSDKKDQVMDSVFYIHGEKNKTVVKNEMGEFNSVFDGKTIYSWNDAMKGGMKMSIECMEEFGNQMDQEGQNKTDNSMKFKSSEKIIEEAGVNIKCEEVKDVDFSIPTDVDFIDQCAMLKVQMREIKKMQNKLPAGAMKGGQ